MKRSGLILPLPVEALESRRFLSNTPGILDTTFNGTGIVETNTRAPAAHMVIQSDGKIVFVGIDQTDSGQISRYNTDGTPDGNATPFSTGNIISGSVNDIVQQSDGKFLVCGKFNGDIAVWRFNADLSPDTTFNSGSNMVDTGITGVAVSIALESTGNIVLGCNDASNAATLMGLNADGTPSSTFRTSTPGGSGTPMSDVAILPGDLIEIAFQYPGSGLSYLFEANADGVTGSSIIILPNQSFTSVTNDGGKILIASTDGTNGWLFRYNTDLSPDTTFGAAGQVELAAGSGETIALSDVTVDSDGNILVTGTSTTSAGNQMLLDRLRPNGSFDLGFGSGLTGQAATPVNGDVKSFGVGVEPDDSIVIAGGSYSAFTLDATRFVGGTYTPPTPQPSPKPTPSVSHLGTVHRRGTSFSTTVTYQSPAGQLIDRSTLSLGNVTLSGSHGSLIHPTSMIIGRQRTGGPLLVIYNFDPLPSGQFVDGRSYGLILGSSQVSDLDSVFCDAAVLGTFDVNFA